MSIKHNKVNSISYKGKPKRISLHPSTIILIILFITAIIGCSWYLISKEYYKRNPKLPEPQIEEIGYVTDSYAEFMLNPVKNSNTFVIGKVKSINKNEYDFIVDVEYENKIHRVKMYNTLDPLNENVKKGKSIIINGFFTGVEDKVYSYDTGSIISIGDFEFQHSEEYNSKSSTENLVEIMPGILTNGKWFFDYKKQRTGIPLGNNLYWNGDYVVDKDGNIGMVKCYNNPNALTDGKRFFKPDGTETDPYRIYQLEQELASLKGESFNLEPPPVYKIKLHENIYFDTQVYRNSVDEIIELKDVGKPVEPKVKANK